MVASLDFLKSRLSRRIGMVVFFGTMALGGLLFLPAHSYRQQEGLRYLEVLSEEVLASGWENGASDVEITERFERVKQRLKQDSTIVGLALYDFEIGQQLDVHGQAPQVETGSLTVKHRIRQRSQEGRFFDVSLPQRVDDRYLLVTRHDLAPLNQQMLLFTVQAVGVILLLSAVVTVGLLMVLERMLIQPLNSLCKDIYRAGDAVCQDQFPQLTHRALNRPDELGEVAVAFQQMVQQVRTEMRDRKLVEAGLRTETEKSERLLLNILPAPIAEKLKADPGAIASRCPEATIMFADIVGFTNLCTHLSPGKLVRQLNTIFSTFDFLAERYGLEKIKTIGDAYMVVGGLTRQRVDHVEAVLEMALDMQQAIRDYPSPIGDPFQIRIGVNTGPVVAGVIGLHKFSYDLWGDAVNIASRMESHGLVNQIQVSEATYHRVKDKYLFESRGSIALKGRGEMKAYILVDHKSAQHAPRRSVKPQYDVEQVHALTTNLLAEVTQVSKIFSS